MNWKVPAVGSALGFLFSLLGGIMGGVGFPDLLLRGFLWAVALGVLAFGFQFLLGQFLPELFEVGSSRPTSGDLESDETASRVDITLGSEGPAMVPVFPEESQDDEPQQRLQSRSSGLPSFGNILEEDVEELPDMGGLTPMRAEVSAGSEPEYSEDSSGSTVAYEGQQEDPAILARAVQTVMKREGDK